MWVKNLDKGGGGFIPFLCGGEKRDILLTNHLRVESSS